MASLAMIDYGALAKNDDAEIQKLMQACQTEGIFYLDLYGPLTEALLEDVLALLQAGHEFFSLPPESDEKTQSLRKGMERGNHAGKGFKYYEIPRDEFHLGTWVLPAKFAAHQERLARVLETFHDITQTVLSRLCTALDVHIAELCNDPAMPSDTALKLVFKPTIHDAKTVINTAHTDFGFITLLWYDEVTTQLPVSDTEGRQTGEWESILVVDGAFLINIADELAAKSTGRLYSPVHRVVALPGAKRVKNGVLYLLRP